MITDGLNGFLVESGNITKYAEKLNILMNDDGLREKFMKEAIKLAERNAGE